MTALTGWLVGTWRCGTELLEPQDRCVPWAWLIMATAAVGPARAGRAVKAEAERWRRPRGAACGAALIGHVAGTRATAGTVTVRLESGRMRADLGFVVVGRTGFEPVTSSVSVQGSCLVAVVDLVMDGRGGRPGWVLVRRRCCHFCCHASCRSSLCYEHHDAFLPHLRRSGASR